MVSKAQKHLVAAAAPCSLTKRKKISAGHRNTHPPTQTWPAVLTNSEAEAINAESGTPAFFKSSFFGAEI